MFPSFLLFLVLYCFGCSVNLLEAWGKPAAAALFLFRFKPHFPKFYKNLSTGLKDVVWKSEEEMQEHAPE